MSKQHALTLARKDARPGLVVCTVIKIRSASAICYRKRHSTPSKMESPSLELDVKINAVVVDYLRAQYSEKSAIATVSLKAQPKRFQANAVEHVH